MRRMSNVLNEEKKQQVVALGRLGWSLRQIEQATSVRRETAGAYLKAAGIAVSGRGRRPSRASRAARGAEVSTDPSSPEPAIPSGDVSIDPGSPKPAISLGEVSTDPGSSRPAISEEVSAEPGTPGPAAHQAKAGSEPSPPPRPWPTPPTRAPQASACEPYREVIEEALERGRNAMAIWQDLVDDHGFRSGYASVRRFVVKLRGSTPVEARVVIRTAPGDEGLCGVPHRPSYAAPGNMRRPPKVVTWVPASALADAA